MVQNHLELSYTLTVQLQNTPLLPKVPTTLTERSLTGHARDSVACRVRDICCNIVRAARDLLGNCGFLSKYEVALVQWTFVVSLRSELAEIVVGVDELDISPLDRNVNLGAEGYGFVQGATESHGEILATV